MVWKMLNKVALLTIAVMLLGCSVSYKFTSTSIDYSRIKTIEIADFPLRSAYVWAPMHSMFNNELADAYATQTKLNQVKRQGDLQLSGEIVEYNQFNKGVSADGYSNLILCIEFSTMYGFINYFFKTIHIKITPPFFINNYPLITSSTKSTNPISSA